MNYAKALPRDKEGGNGMQQFPAPFRAQARFYRDNGAVSSVQTLTDNTTQIEVGGTAGVMIRWIPTSEGAAAPAGSVLTTNFDHYVPANVVRQFVVPRESTPVNSVVGVNIQQGLYRRVAISTVSGNASILTSEF